jgi:hypothetical protein
MDAAPATEGGHSTLPSPRLSAPQIIAHHEYILQPFVTLVGEDEPTF